MSAKEVAGKEIEREYRKGNWTLEETMLLIEAKKMDKERRTKRSSSGGGSTELRWKWIEDYCWKVGCCRSQNQCNDKWDNLMRDFKKVKKHEMIMEASGEEDFSFWKLNGHEKKEKGLPSNFLRQVYEALSEMVERADDKSLAPPLLSLAQAPPLLSLPPVSNGLDADPRRNLSGSPPRKRVRERKEERDGLASAIAKSVEVIEEAIMAGEEKEEKRHKELLDLKERRMRVEQVRAETAAEAMVGLVAAVDKLARSIRRAR